LIGEVAHQGQHMSVLAGLHARREAVKKATKQALDKPLELSPPSGEGEADDPLWEL